MLDKILFVLDSLKGGGFERRMSQLIIGLNKYKNQFEVHVLLPKNAPVDYTEAISSGIIIHEYTSSSDFINIIKELKPAIVHSCSPYKSLLLNRLKLMMSFKYVVGFIADANRPNFFSKRGLGFMASYPFADAIVGNSQAGLDAYRCPKKKSYVIYNGFDPIRLYLPESTDLQDIRKQYDFVVSMVARMEDDKDYYTYLDLAEKFMDQSSLVFLIVGKGRNESSIRNYCESKHLTNVKFLGFRKDVMNVFKISDLTVLLSKIGKHKEGISNSIMESMAVGTPVVATMDGGTLEIIQDGNNSFMVSDNNLVEITRILYSFLNEKIDRKKLSEQAMQTIQQKFLLSRMVEDYIQLYKKLCK